MIVRAARSRVGRREQIGGRNVGLTVWSFDQRKLREVVRIGGFVGRVVDAGCVDLVRLLRTDRYRLLPRLGERSDLVGQRKLLRTAMVCDDGVVGVDLK